MDKKGQYEAHNLVSIDAYPCIKIIQHKKS